VGLDATMPTNAPLDQQFFILFFVAEVTTGNAL
jgi:hypothetical protein